MNSESMCRLSFGASDVYSVDNFYRDNGNSVRCIAQTRHTITVSLGAGVESVEIDGTSYNNGDTVLLEEGSTHNIDMTPQSGYAFDSWSISGSGASVGNTTTKSTTLAIGSADATLTAEAIPTQCDSTKLCIQYNGNGLTYASTGLGVNDVNYNSTTTQTEFTRYSHTSNISDNGTRSGNYSANLATKDVVTIPGATTLHATITYGTQNNYDMLYVFQGEYTGSVTRNMSAGQLQKYMGGSNTTTTVTLDIPGDTATFAFYSNGSSHYYGYYAVITSTVTEHIRTVASGEYSTPSTPAQLFYGWSTNSSATLPSEVEYTNESEVMNNISGNEGDTITLYAVWQEGHEITFNFDSNVSSLDILDVDHNTISTITTSGASTLLAEGSTYIFKPTHTSGYATDTITKTSGSGTLSGNTFTVGSGDTTISVTSKVMPPLQNFDCSTLAVGGITEAYDARDNQVYTVKKFYMDSNHTTANAKCWMSNLNLGDTDNYPLVVSSLTSANTHLPTDGSKDVPASTFNSWKKTSGSSSFTSAEFISRPSGLEDKYGNKYGTMYNFCAVSVGTICTSTNSSNASYDLCPSGWRLPVEDTNGEFQALYDAYSITDDITGSTRIQRDFGFSRAGAFVGGAPGDVDRIGGYWSSIRLNNTDMYRLYVWAEGVGPANYVQRNGGNSIRCINE